MLFIISNQTSGSLTLLCNFSGYRKWGIFIRYSYICKHAIQSIKKTVFWLKICICLKDILPMMWTRPNS